jgi:hypothetical protein
MEDGILREVASNYLLQAVTPGAMMPPAKLFIRPCSERAVRVAEDHPALHRSVEVLLGQWLYD